MSAAIGALAPIVSLNNLTIAYRQHPALHHISGRFARGALTAVMGPNGAGKSTLLKSIVGLVGRAGASGGVDLHVPQHRIAYLAQSSELERDFPMDVRDCVLLGCWNTCGAWGTVDAALLARVGAALHTVGLQGFARRSVGSLSCGQFQRVLFARVLVQDATLILLDEPFNAVDAKTTAALLALLAQWKGAGRTTIAVLHDEALVRQHFPETLLLAREVVAWGATAEVLTEAHLRRARAMAEAWDDDAPLCHIDDALEAGATSDSKHAAPAPRGQAPAELAL